MVSDKYLKEYAYNIYMKKVGYSFERVLELFPMYYPIIYGYYQQYMNEERRKSATNIIMIGLSAVQLLANADKYWNENIERFFPIIDKYKQSGIDNFGAYVKDFTDYALSSVKYGVKIINGYRKAKIYAEAIGATDYAKLADELIASHLEYINRTVEVMKSLSNRINDAGGQNG